MIVDNIRKASRYYGLGNRIETALRYLARTDFSTVETGRYDLDGDNVYALVQRYDSKPRDKGLWEAHRRYLDVQFIAAGAETLGYAWSGDMKVSVDYDRETDVFFLQGEGQFLTAREGTFIVFAPEEAHMPGLAVDGPQPVTKVVVKVKVG